MPRYVVIFNRALVRDRFASLRRDDRGATAVEYGLIVALIAAVIIGIVTTLGGQVADAFSSVVSGF